jgi:trk system potassium uptake protein TrkH
MFISGINFTLVYCLFSKKVNQLTKDEEFRWYVAIVIIAVVAFMAGFRLTGLQASFADDFRSALFHTISTFTSTGYCGMNSDFVAWGPLFWILTLILMITGASAGSTSGGIKLVRIMILLKNTVNEFYRQIHPRAVVPVHINDHVISFETVSKVLAFVFIYVLLTILSILLLVAMGLSFDTAIGSAVTCISNGGVGMGDTGPSGSFAVVPAAGKWFCAFLMLVGRLEIFTVLVLFSPNFWRKQ